MNRYSMVIYWSEADDCFLGECPELPGCMADGTTSIEAAQNLDAAILLWLETADMLGRDIPEPNRIREIA